MVPERSIVSSKFAISVNDDVIFVLQTRLFNKTNCTLKLCTQKIFLRFDSLKSRPSTETALDDVHYLTLPLLSFAFLVKNAKGEA